MTRRSRVLRIIKNAVSHSMPTASFEPGFSNDPQRPSGELEVYVCIFNVALGKQGSPDGLDTGTQRRVIFDSMELENSGGLGVF